MSSLTKAHGQYCMIAGNTVASAAEVSSRVGARFDRLHACAWCLARIPSFVYACSHQALQADSDHCFCCLVGRQHEALVG